MPQLTRQGVRTSLAVGFHCDGGLPERMKPFVGVAHRDIEASDEFPFEDSQFDVVMIDGRCVNARSVREAHRVLRPSGRLMFIVNEKTRSQDGMTLPGIYKIVREGFNIVEVGRQPWWLFGLRGRTIAICAQKKNWRSHTNTYRPYL